MFRYTIRDVLWLTVVVALAVAWWIDNKRIDQAVGKLAVQQRLLEINQEKVEQERRLMQADFDDRVAVVNDLQLQAKRELERRIEVPVSRLIRIQSGADAEKEPKRFIDRRTPRP